LGDNGPFLSTSSELASRRIVGLKSILSGWFGRWFGRWLSRSEPLINPDRVYIPFDEFCKIHQHCETLALEREVIGLLLGDIFRDRYGPYTRIFAPIIGKSSGSAVHVQFDREGIAEVMAQLHEFQNGSSICPIDKQTLFDRRCSSCGYDMKNTKMVGWYHSHPGHGAFMSGTDIRTQEQYFNFDHLVAIVDDPLSGEYGVWQSTNGVISQSMLYGFKIG
jgi:proteasome lid subunit RPN8/RPN11